MIFTRDIHICKSWSFISNIWSELIYRGHQMIIAQRRGTYNYATVKKIINQKKLLTNIWLRIKRIAGCNRSSLNLRVYIIVLHTYSGYTYVPCVRPRNVRNPCYRFPLVITLRVTAKWKHAGSDTLQEIKRLLDTPGRHHLIYDVNRWTSLHYTRN